MPLLEVPIYFYLAQKALLKSLTVGAAIASCNEGTSKAAKSMLSKVWFENGSPVKTLLADTKYDCDAAKGNVCNSISKGITAMCKGGTCRADCNMPLGWPFDKHKRH